MSGLEALAALGLACNIFQVISFGRDTISLAKEAYRMGVVDPALTDSDLIFQLSNISSRIQGVTKPSKASKSDQRLLGVAKKCQDAARDIQEEIAFLAGLAKKGSVSATFQAAAKTTWRKKRLERLERSLADAERAMQTGLMVGIIERAGETNILVNQLDQTVQTFFEAYKDGHRDVSNLIARQALRTEKNIAARMAKAQESLKLHITHQSQQSEHNIKTQVSLSTEATIEGVTAGIGDLAVDGLRQARRERLMASLKFASMNERRNAISESQPDTFRWVLEVQDEAHSDSSSEGSESSDETVRQSSQPDTTQGVLGALFLKEEGGSSSPGKSSESESNTPRSGDEEYGDSDDEWEAPNPAAWDSFTEWLCSSGAVYWISGKPASGKSTLVKYITQHERTQSLLDLWSPKTLILSHFFWKPGSQMQRSIKGLLCSLLHQLLQEDPASADRLLDNSTDFNRKDHDTDWSVSELESTCVRLFAQLGRLPRALSDLYQELWSRLNNDIPLFREKAALYFKLCCILNPRAGRLEDGPYERMPFNVVLATLATASMAHGIIPEIATTAESLAEACRRTEMDIRARSAGLLEIRCKQRGTNMVARVTTRNPDWHQALAPYYDPGGTFVGHVDFIHRSAYDFVFDTEAGKTLLSACNISDERLKFMAVRAQCALHHVYRPYLSDVDDVLEAISDLLRRCSQFPELVRKAPSKCELMGLVYSYQRLFERGDWELEEPMVHARRQLILGIGKSPITRQEAFLVYAADADLTDFILETMQNGDISFGLKSKLLHRLIHAESLYRCHLSRRIKKRSLQAKPTKPWRRQRLEQALNRLLENGADPRWLDNFVLYPWMPLGVPRRIRYDPIESSTAGLVRRASEDAQLIDNEFRQRYPPPQSTLSARSNYPFDIFLFQARILGKMIAFGSDLKELFGFTVRDMDDRLECLADFEDDVICNQAMAITFMPMFKIIAKIIERWLQTYPEIGDAPEVLALLDQLDQFRAMPAGMMQPTCTYLCIRHPYDRSDWRSNWYAIWELREEDGRRLQENSIWFAVRDLGGFDDKSPKPLWGDLLRTYEQATPCWRGSMHGFLLDKGFLVAGDSWRALAERQERFLSDRAV